MDIHEEAKLQERDRRVTDAINGAAEDLINEARDAEAQAEVHRMRAAVARQAAESILDAARIGAWYSPCIATLLEQEDVESLCECSPELGDDLISV